MSWLRFLCSITAAALLAPSAAADVSQLHVEMRGIPNEVCLRCHAVIQSATGTGQVIENPAHGIHLHVVPTCSDCHTTVDLAQAASQPWKSQVEPQVCYHCHQGETTMVQQVLETTVTVGAAAERVMQTLDTRVHLPVEGEFLGSETCGGCHEEVYEYWKNGPHARAMSSPIFDQAWEANIHAQACLRCHTTAFDPASGEFAEKGVGCEVCHGAMVENHPDVVQGQPEFSAPLCANCHLDEWGEWRSSRHAETGIECDSCHSPHGQNILFPTVQELCAACHEERGEIFAHSTHASRNLLCSECHMHPAEHGGKTGHTFSVGSGTCIRCHRDEIHARERIVALGAEVKELRQTDESTLRKQIMDQGKRIERLETSRSLRLYTGLLQGSLIGLAVGGVGAWTAARRWREEEVSEDDIDKAEKDPPSPEQA